jgi:HEAT repeat protein
MKKKSEKLLQNLQDKQKRVEAFIELANIADSNSIKPLIESIKKMTWDEALTVAGHLGNYEVRIIPHLERLLKPSEGSRIYTSAIKGLGETKTEKAFKILFPLLKREEKWLLSNDVTFGETIDALVSCGQGHLKEFMELLDSSNWLIRSGGIYACGKLSCSNKQDRKLVKKLENKLNTLLMEDRSAKVRNLAANMINRMNEKKEMKESYRDAMSDLLTELREEDLYEKYEEKIEQILNFINYLGWPISANQGHWNIKYPPYDGDIIISLAKDDVSGEGFLKIFTRIQTLPSRNILPLYRQLLEWNEIRYTGSAKFFVEKEWVVLGDVKILESVDPPEVVHSIEVVSEMAKKYFELIKDDF